LPCGFLAARPPKIVLFSDAHRPSRGDRESMHRAKTVSEKNELGREAPMIITPAALLRLVMRILRREAQR
jgi:hypothetical protein